MCSREEVVLDTEVSALFVFVLIVLGFGGAGIIRPMKVIVPRSNNDEIVACSCQACSRESLVAVGRGYERRSLVSRSLDLELCLDLALDDVDLIYCVSVEATKKPKRALSMETYLWNIMLFLNT
jgi:hypothetical protein